MHSYFILDITYPYPLENLFSAFDGRYEYISLNDRYWDFSDDAVREFKEKLKPYLYSDKIAEAWYGYWKLPQDKQELKISVYNNCEEVRNTILSYVEDLFWRHADLTQSVFPQDICFFRQDKSILVGTVSHECMLEIFVPNKNEVNFLEDNAFIIHDVEQPYEF